MKEQVLDIEAMIFDLDGTLIDSVPVYYRLMESILETIGLPPVSNHLIAEFMINGLETLEKIIPENKKDNKNHLIQEFISVGRKISENVFRDEVKLFPGVPELFLLLAEQNIAIGVVSSTHKQNMERKLEPLARNGLREALSVVIAIEDAPKRKPAPDPLIECAHRLAVPTKKCVYVGDSHVDISAGRTAGMMTIGVLTGLDDYKTLERERPTLILDGVYDIHNLSINSYKRNIPNIGLDLEFPKSKR